MEYQRLTGRKVKYEKTPVQFKEPIHMLNPYYGPKLQYQRAEIPPGGDCNTIGDWLEQTSGQLDVAASGDPRASGGNSITLTQTVAAGGTAVYNRFRISGTTYKSIDLSWARYVGFWYKGGNNNQFDPGDLALYLFTREGNYLYANRSEAVDIFRTQYIAAATATWHYMEIDLMLMVKASGYEGDRRTEVWGVGFQSIAGDNLNALNVDWIEFYTHGTGYGPARGRIMSAPLADDVHAIKGYALAWDPMTGRVMVAADNEVDFAGICTANPSRSRVFAAITAADTSFYVVDPSLFRRGKCTVWDDSNSEAVTISAVNKVTHEITCSAFSNSYAVAAFCQAAMEGNEAGDIRVDFVVDGVVNMYCEDTSIAAGEGVAISQAGATPMIDDGGGTSWDVMIGRALEAGDIATEIIPVLLGLPGDTA